VDWDVEKERVVNDADAERLMQPNYRKPWKLKA
jgi:hypothetical protein